MKKPTEFELAVCSALQKEKVEEENFDYYGDEFYPFVKECVPFLKDSSKKATISLEGLKKKDKIVKENTIRLIQATLSKIHFDEKTLVVPPIFSSKTLENRAICFMYCCWFYLKNPQADLFQVYSLIVSIQRFSENVKGTPFAKGALEDLMAFCKKMCHIFCYSGKMLYEKTPELIAASPYDIYVPKLYIKPYSHQREAVDMLRNETFVKNGFVCIYSLSTNSGKTFTAAGIASIIEKLGNITFLFCCDILPVRQKVESLMLYSGIKKAVVCSPNKAYEILSTTPLSREKFVLFIDEITLNAHYKSETLKTHMKLLSVAPKWTYISGANLEGESLRFISEIHRVSFETSLFKIITSQTIFSSVSAYTFSGKEVSPHMFCTKLDGLKYEIEKILLNQFKGRLYTPSTVSGMLEKAKKIITWSMCDDDKNPTAEEMIEVQSWFNRFPDVEKIFQDVSQIYPDNIRKIAMDILQIMVDFEDDYCCEIFCKPRVNEKKIDLYNLSYELFPNNNIVAHPDPENFALAMFSKHISEVKANIGSCDSLINKYENAVAVWEKQKKSVLEHIKDEKERLLMESEIFQKRPEFGFPEEFQINTKDYCRKRNVVMKKYRKPLELKNINTVGVSEELLILLYSGVGVLSSKQTLSRAYTKQVLSLVEDGKLEFLITDICYGFDYPFGCLFITNEFFSQKSTTDIFQLMSRVGRGRLSYFGQIYMDDGCAEKIFGEDDTQKKEIQNMYEVLIGKEWEDE